MLLARGLRGVIPGATRTTRETEIVRTWFLPIGSNGKGMKMTEWRGIKNPFIVRNVPCGWFNVTLALGRPKSMDTGVFPEFVADRPAGDIVPENWCCERDEDGSMILIDDTILFPRKKCVTGGEFIWHPKCPSVRWPV